MVEKLAGVKISGRCFTEEKQLIFFPKNNNRISIVYGKNGSGKTTLSDGLLSFSNESVIPDICASFIDIDQNDIPNSEEFNVYVFNEKYVDSNIKIAEDGLGTIVLFGGQVSTQEEIDLQENLVKKLDNEYTALNDKLQDYNNAKSPLNPQYHYNRISKSLKENGWAEKNAKIKGHKRNTAVTDEIINEICKLTTPLSLSEIEIKYSETQEKLNKTDVDSDGIPSAIDTIYFDESLEEQIIKMLSKEISKPVLSTREKLIFDVIEQGNQAMVIGAQNVFSDETIEYCPFCFRDIEEEYKKSLLNSIKTVLNKEVDDHVYELEKVIFPTLCFDFSSHKFLNPDSIANLNKQVEKFNDIIVQYRNLLEQKKQNIYTPINVNSLGLNIILNNINKILSDFENERVSYVDAVKNRNNLVDELVYYNKCIAHIQIEQLYKDYLKCIREKELLVTEVNNKNTELKTAKDKLRSLEQAKSDVGLAIDTINNALDYVFFSNERLSIELKNDKYYLKSNGCDVAPKNISLGERNILGLCYFFTQIMSNQDINKLYTNEVFIVIDDPVSSFDFENKVGIHSYLRYQINRIVNGNTNSKILILTHDLETFYSIQKASDEITTSFNQKTSQNKITYCSSNLSKCNLLPFNRKQNEYKNLITLVYNFATGDVDDNNLIIGNAMRRVLESFSTFTYRKGIEQVSCDPNVLCALKEYSDYFENLMYRLVLHGESHFEDQIYIIHNGYNFYEFISEDEKIKTARNILCFMYLLNPYHIQAYLDEANAIHNIEKWIKDIPNNDSFKTPKTTRVVKLFDLRVSAGIGNNNFEDLLPYSDYETDNEKCDYALKVSGDSMIPKIHDEDTILVVKSSTIEPGETGIFNLNGRLYCKYLSYKNDEAFLCSFNRTYEPIKINDEDTLTVLGRVIQIIH